MGTTRKIVFFEGQKKIAWLWGISFAVLFVIILILTMTRFKGCGELVWNWFLPNTIPTLALIVGVLVVESKAEDKSEERKVNKFFFDLTYSASGFYLFVILILILIGVFSTSSILCDIVKSTNIFLGPLQGIVTTSLGIFFMKKD